MPGWVQVSIGGLLRAMASSNTIVNDAIVSGETVPQDIVMQVVEQQIMLNRDTDGIVIDGYPRDLNQVQEFENKVITMAHIYIQFDNKCTTVYTIDLFSCFYNFIQV